MLPGGIAVPAGGVAVLPGGVAESAGGVAVLPGGVAEPAGGVAVLPGGVAVPADGVAVPGVELCPAEPEPPAGAVPPEGELWATTQVAQHRMTAKRVSFVFDIFDLGFKGPSKNGVTLILGKANF